MIKKEDIEKICTPLLHESEFLVEVKINRSNDIIIYVDDYEGISIENCQRISRGIEACLNRDEEDYSLEVSSPGLSNPFKIKEQYIKNINNEIEAILTDGEKLAGKLLKVNDDSIIFEQEITKKIENKKQKIKEEIEIKFNNIKSTRRVISFI